MKNALPIPHYAQNALEIFENHKGYLPIRHVLENINIGDRQFRRKFKEITGLNPKTYGELLNAHFIINYIQNKDYKSIEDLAYNSDFYDVAHFCHRFKQITGFKPTAFINDSETDFAKLVYSVL